MNTQAIYSKEEFLNVLRNAKARKQKWQAKAIKELEELQVEMDDAKKIQHLNVGHL